MRSRVTVRRNLVVATVCAALLLVGGGALVHVVTGARPAAAPRPVPEKGVAAAKGARPALAEREVVAGAPAPGPHARGDSAEPRSAAPLLRAPGGIKILLKLDPRLTKSLHMGTRWVSPPTWVGTQGGNLFTVQARADGVAAGRAVRDPTWLPSEPDMVAVTPERGREVELVVLREGTSTLTVEEGGVKKTVTVNAVQRDGVWQVQISQ